MRGSVVWEIYDFNKKCGFLDKKTFNANKEAEYLIEEALELVGRSDDKLLARRVVEQNSVWYRGATDIKTLSAATKAKLADALLDAIVFAFGGLFKLGFSPTDAVDALYIVVDANKQKLGAGTDSEGKQLKPKQFIPPDAALEKFIEEKICK